MVPPRASGWSVEVAACSAGDLVGIDRAWEAVVRHRDALTGSGELAQRRAEQARTWLWSEVQDSLIADLREQLGAGHAIAELEAAVSAGRVPATRAAEKLLEIYLENKRG